MGALGASLLVVQVDGVRARRRGSTSTVWKQDSAEMNVRSSGRPESDAELADAGITLIRPALGTESRDHINDSSARSAWAVQVGVEGDHGNGGVAFVRSCRW